MPRKSTAKSPLDALLADTQQLVTRLLRENRALKAQNQRLDGELERISKGWEQIKELARKAPRKARRAVRR
jgi:predicted RNase H-like nuclease (RuvC/YqgF family)